MRLCSVEKNGCNKREGYPYLGGGLLMRFLICWIMMLNHRVFSVSRRSIMSFTVKVFSLLLQFSPVAFIA